MLALLLALAAEPAAVRQDAPPPSSAQAGALTVSQGSMMGWSSGGRLGGEVAFTVSNTGGPDRVVSVTTPAGPTGDISVQVARDGGVVRLEPGDTAVEPVGADGTAGRSRVTATLTDLAHGVPSSVPTVIEVVFEHAGVVTVTAGPVSPAPASR